jgi:hypothetical protein
MKRAGHCSIWARPGTTQEARKLSCLLSSHGETGKTDKVHPFFFKKNVRVHSAITAVRLPRLEQRTPTPPTCLPLARLIHTLIPIATLAAPAMSVMASNRSSELLACPAALRQAAAVVSVRTWGPATRVRAVATEGAGC